MPISLQSAPITIADTVTASPLLVPSVIVSAGSNRILIVVFHGENNGGTAGDQQVTSMSFSGQPMLKVADQLGATWSTCEIWYLLAPPVTTSDVTININTGAFRRAAGAYVFTGVDQTTPYRTPVKSTGTGATSVSNTVTGVASTDFLLDGLTVDGSPHSIVFGANQTEKWDITPGAGIFDGASDNQSGVDGGVMSHTWTTAAEFSHIAVALIEAATTVSGPPPPLQQPVTMGGRW